MIGGRRDGAEDASGVVFDIQHYAVHDGPGIRTLVFLKGCPLRCLWCCNPESQEFGPELRHSEARCKHCLRCRDLCWRGAVRDGPVYARERCAGCVERPCVEGCWESALAVSGRRMRASEVVQRVAADVDFYRASGGGVTLSGGEPLAQPRFAQAILRACRALGIATAVETCGHVREDDLLATAPLVDLFLYDVKMVDPAEHERLTGARNDLVLANLRRLAALCPERVVVRLPFVPGYTDRPADVDALARLLLELGLSRLELQPYHSLGAFKYAELGRVPPLDLPPEALDGESLLRARDAVAARGLACDVNQ